MGGRGEDKAVTDECEALLGEFSLEELIVGAREELSLSAGDGGDQMVDGDGFAVEGALFVTVGGELNGLDGSGLGGAVVVGGLLGEDCPEA